MRSDWFYKFDTLSLHAGQRPDAATGARAVPVYNSTSYVFRDTDHAAGLFNLEEAGHIYSRISNPTVAVKRHVENAAVVAAFLERHDAVEWVSYPGLPSHPQHDLAKKLLPKGSGALLTFGIRGGLEAGVAFIESLELWSHLANVGDAKSLVIHPASTTHQQMTAEELAESGVTQEMVRLSVGLEDPGDLTADLDRALKRSQKQVQRPRAVAS